MLVSVIVTTYNRPDALVAVLEALCEQDDPYFEVIVADDGSDEATAGAIRRLQRLRPAAGMSRLAHAWHPDEGFRASAARNMAVAHARGDYLVFLDGDCLPRRDFVSRHRALAEAGFMVSGSRVLLSRTLTDAVLADPGLGVHRRGFGFWIRQRFAGRTNKVLSLLRMPDHLLRRYRSVRWRRIKSCNLAIWRDHFDAVNGFDESFVGWGHEDADLVLRLARHGVRRKSGAFGTEVFHLYHPENDRANESANRTKVEARLQSGLVRVTDGLSAHPGRGERFAVIAGQAPDAAPTPREAGDPAGRRTAPASS
jgi:glycosyltransferase involved in cell wall biosynthesis